MSVEATPTTAVELTQKEILCHAGAIAKHFRDYIDRIKQKQKNFHNWLKKGEHLSESERKCFSHESIRDATTYWTSISQQKKSDFDTQHQTGWRFWAKTSQTVAAAAGQFLNDFKPLVEFASNSGPYGGLAVGAVSGLFAIAQSKSKTDDIIASAMANLMDRLPGFKMLQEIYDESDALQKLLRGKVILAYTGIIEFAMASAKYYLKLGIKRWWLATWNSQKFIVMADRVQGLVLAVRLQSEDLLTSTVNYVRKQNTELANKVKELEAEITQLQKDSDNNKLLSLRNLLRLSGWSPEGWSQSLHEYKGALERARKDSRIFEWMHGESIAKYRDNDKFFKDWNKSHESSMLLIIGLNHRSCRRRDHCWVSPLALQLIDEAQTNDMELVYHVFNFESYTSIHTAMAKLMFQLLKLQRHVNLATLSPKLEKYRDELEILEKHRNERSSKYSSGNSEAVRKALKEAAVAIVRDLDPKQRIRIILDRVDRCEGKEQVHLLHLLIQIMEESRCCVKIFAVANEAFWEVEGYQIEDFEKYQNFKMVTKPRKMTIGG
ncbi:uncharacterized protein Bfra_010138 [Botrytis fragariae]|uniref:Uncharacterized protein n=1 Tax=Botrytis fragariae TaxID=1964551 RepID=A0A8H6ALM1_9HELO|nr:uncharacterized protein Bfra_010138 [Botrytis fragariae]KAF5869993.1 hypothetical protein Bfra_010138 [Botrytis fragariae]